MERIPSTYTQIHKLHAYMLPLPLLLHNPLPLAPIKYTSPFPSFLSSFLSSFLPSLFVCTHLLHHLTFTTDSKHSCGHLRDIARFKLISYQISTHSIFSHQSHTHSLTRFLKRFCLCLGNEVVHASKSRMRYIS